MIKAKMTPRRVSRVTSIFIQVICTIIICSACFSALYNEKMVYAKAMGIPKKEMDPLLPSIRHTIDDHIYFLTFDGSNVFTNQDTTRGTTVRRPQHLESQMFVQVRKDVIRYLEQQKSVKFQDSDCNYIRYRLIPTVGMELDVTCHSSNKNQSERVTLLQRFQPSEVIFHQQNKNTRKVNIIVPLMGRPESFKLFLEGIQRILQEGDHILGLTIVYFDDDYTEENRKILSKANKTIKGLETDFILLESQPFSRSKGLQIGVEKSQIEAEVVFLCDVDIFFNKDFLRRCQANPIQNSQVYFPVIFSLFNPEFIYAMQGRKIPSPLDTCKIGDDHGFWRVYGHGMVCVYKSDFLKINGFNKDRKGWGGEDITFLSVTVQKKYKVIRALEPALFHHYHYKNCQDAGKGQGGACRKVQAMTEASRINFGLWFYKHKFNTSVYGLLKDGTLPYDSQALEELQTDRKKSYFTINIFLILSVVFNIYFSVSSFFYHKHLLKC